MMDYNNSYDVFTSEHGRVHLLWIMTLENATLRSSERVTRE